jgi:hypothetical protein
MLEDLERNLDLLLKHGFIEANNRLDEYCDDVDTVKLTSYGSYMIGELAFHFTYLDLICTDCGVYDEQVSNYLSAAANEEYGLFVKEKRLDRVRVRLDRVEKFINYLREEEMREREVYSLNMPEEDMFTSKCIRTFEAERKRVLASAKRQAQVHGGGVRRAR